MAVTLMVVGAIALIWVAVALAFCAQRRCTFHQAFLLVPLAVWHRLGLRGGTHLRSKPPVLYAVLHQSYLDPALMLSLLPDDTLHILDEQSARSLWLEPWREMARTIAFNPEHFFVSRRLVRHLKGNGRLAVHDLPSFPYLVRKHLNHRADDQAPFRPVAVVLAAGLCPATGLSP